MIDFAEKMCKKHHVDYSIGLLKQIKGEKTNNNSCKDDFSKYKDTYVKLVVVNKTNPYAFDLLFDSIYKAGPLDITIIEDPTVLLDSEEDVEVDEAEDTATILRKYVGGLTLPVNNDKMKDFMLDVYNEALQVETV